MRTQQVSIPLDTAPPLTSQRNFGYAVARAYAGHTDNGTTSTYVRASLSEVAAALVVTGEPGVAPIRWPPEVVFTVDDLKPLAGRLQQGLLSRA